MKVIIICLIAAALLAALAITTACQSDQSRGSPRQQLAKNVDLERFMGKWHVHGYTPTRIDRDAYNATESYELKSDGRIQTTYQFRKGGFDGPLKTYRPVGSVYDTESNAEWRMRFFGIINAPYYIVYVDADYQFAVIGHPNRKLAWIMSRSSSIAESDYAKLRAELESRDYELDALQRVEHQ